MNHKPRITNESKRGLHVLCCNSSQQGQALIITVLLFLTLSSIIGTGVVNPTLRGMREGDDFTRTRASLFASEAVNEDALYRIANGKQFLSPSTLAVNGYTAIATSTSVTGGVEVRSSGSGFQLTRNLKTFLAAGSGAAFHYGMQSGEGGITLSNTATIAGNVFSNGPVTGTNSNLVKGTVVSAGPNGIIDGVHATSSVYAHTIRNATIDGDAYYQSISGTTVAGTLHPGSPDEATSSLPISDAMIAEWESAATAGGVHSSPCPYSIGGAVTLGPKKINCDLNLYGDAVLTLAGPVWVSGNIDVSNQAEVRVSAALGNKSIALIADKQSAPTTAGKITLSNTTEYFGSGDPNSYVLMVSQNTSAETGGSTPAITISNSAGGKLLLYAPHGLVQLSNSVKLKEVTAYKIQVNNSAEVKYETGLANLLFTSGPSGGYELDGWREVE